MTPTQRAVARHALGLPNDGNRSYRNRYFANVGGTRHGEWQEMVALGVARRGALSGDLQAFHLTRAGAERALLPNETLDREDFQPIGQD